MAFKRYQFSARKPCFYCGAPPPSIKEHVPPKTMFAGFECDRITVPSCAQHNTERTAIDAAVITGLRMSASWIYRNAPLSPRLTSNVVKAISDAGPTFPFAKSSVQLRPYLEEPAPGLDSDLPYLEPSVPVHSWVRQLTAGLVWSITGEHDPLIMWDATEVWSQNFVPTDGPLTAADAIHIAVRDNLRKARLNEGDWYHGWSAAPRRYPLDIYRFDIRVVRGSSTDPSTQIIFRHRFYNDTAIWYALLQATSEMASKVTAAAMVLAPPRLR